MVSIRIIIADAAKRSPATAKQGPDENREREEYARSGGPGYEFLFNGFQKGITQKIKLNYKNLTSFF